MAWPSSFIFGLPFTAMMTWHTSIKASLVQVLCSQSKRISFRSSGPSAFEILSWTPRGIMSLRKSFHTTDFASIPEMNWSWKWTSTCLAAWKGKSHISQPTNTSCHCRTTLHTLWAGSTVTVSIEGYSTVIWTNTIAKLSIQRIQWPHPQYIHSNV